MEMMMPYSASKMATHRDYGPVRAQASMYFLPASASWRCLRDEITPL
jgi:hypothetical protein